MRASPANASLSCRAGLTPPGGDLRPRTTCLSRSPHGSGTASRGGSEGELAAVEVVVPRGVAEQVGQCHVPGEEGIPAGRVLHAARQVGGGGGVELTMQGSEDAVEL